MTDMPAPITQLWPQPAVLDEQALIALYAPDRSRPSVRVNFVSSLDGAVEVGGYSAGLSGEADRRIFSLLRMHCDALLVGAGTLRHEGYRALRLDERRQSWRQGHSLPETPTLAVVSATLDLNPRSAVFTEAPHRPVILTHAAAPADRRTALEPVADVIICGETVVDLAIGLAELNRRGLAQVLCEGGPHLFGTLHTALLVDELCLTLSPLLAGPGAGRIIAGALADTIMRMHLVHTLLSQDMLLMRYVRTTQ